MEPGNSPPAATPLNRTVTKKSATIPSLAHTDLLWLPFQILQQLKAIPCYVFWVNAAV